VESEGAVADQADLGVEAFQAAVGEMEADRGEDAVAVLAQRARQLHERTQSGAGGPGEPGVDMVWGECRLGQVVEQPELPRAAGRRGRGGGSRAGLRRAWRAGGSSDARAR
jgi:hypothetical protein